MRTAAHGVQAGTSQSSGPYRRPNEDRPYHSGAGDVESTAICSIEEVTEELKGAQIESLEMGDNGLHIVLADGRMLLFPDAVLIALLSAPERTLQ